MPDYIFTVITSYSLLKCACVCVCVHVPLFLGQVVLILSSSLPDSESSQKEPASALLWAYYYLAQHYDYLGNTEKALSYIDAAIEHTPTLIELFVTKGRIYKVRNQFIVQVTHSCVLSSVTHFVLGEGNTDNVRPMWTY